MNHMSPLQKARLDYKPEIPHTWKVASRESLDTKNEELKELFPHTWGQSLICFTEGERGNGQSKKVGVVLSGGQAAGGHNVICGLFDALQALHPDSQLFGFLGGPSGIVNGKFKKLTKDSLADFRNQGGFDLIGSGRTKIETEEQLQASLKSVNALDLDALVVIGGDDSNTNAAVLAEFFKKESCKTCVIGVPKTIDGDLQNEYVDISFGFDTACKVYSELIGNIARDALSAKKYTHFIKLMGRSASHIALECALQTHPNLTLIAEEVAEKKLTLQQITGMIADMVMERARLGKNFGVILIPEGLIEFIPEVASLVVELNRLLEKIPVNEIATHLTQESLFCYQTLPKAIQEQLLKERDPHGNLQVALIDTEKLLISTVSAELKSRGFTGQFHPLAHSFGYEGRSAMPSNFDANYCYALGNVAALLIQENVSGYMCFIQNLNKEQRTWKAGGVPLLSLMALEERKGKKKPVIKKALVDLQKAAFKSFEKERASWLNEEAYRFPGPIQFFGDKEVTDTFPLSLK